MYFIFYHRTILFTLYYRIFYQCSFLAVTVVINACRESRICKRGPRSSARIEGARRGGFWTAKWQLLVHSGRYILQLSCLFRQNSALGVGKLAVECNVVTFAVKFCGLPSPFWLRTKSCRWFGLLTCFLLLQTVQLIPYFTLLYVHTLIMQELK